MVTSGWPTHAFITYTCLQNKQKSGKRKEYPIISYSCHRAELLALLRDLLQTLLLPPLTSVLLQIPLLARLPGNARLRLAGIDTQKLKTNRRQRPLHAARNDNELQPPAQLQLLAQLLVPAEPLETVKPCHNQGM